jgi:Flp pilus assembly protein TadG
MILTKDNKRRGCAALEVTLMLPWILTLFIGTVDFGFYGYAIINIQNAARVAVLQTSASSTTAASTSTACTAALAEMGSLANLNGVSTCTALPLIVTASAITGVDGRPASRVAVTYRTPQLIPFPTMTGRLTLTRTAQFKVRN